MLGVDDGQGGLACCDSWGRKELDMTERLNWTAFRVDKEQDLTYLGNYIQPSRVNHNGKKCLKKNICVKLSYCPVQQKLAQHCKSTILQWKKGNTFFFCIISIQILIPFLFFFLHTYYLCLLRDWLVVKNDWHMWASHPSLAQFPTALSKGDI